MPTEPVIFYTVRDGFTVKLNPARSFTARDLELNQWVDRHNAAVAAPTVVEGVTLQAIRHVADIVHNAQTIGLDDPLWREQVGIPLVGAIRNTLNWDLGRLDGGTLDAVVCDLLVELGADL